jgi:glutathione synthase/RimK-type ligase-like ATP-grasp enzyme
VPQGTGLSFSQENGLSVVRFGELRLAPAAVWWRKPAELALEGLDTDSIRPWAREYARDAVRRHTRALRAHFIDAFWMSPPYAMERAANKSLQLQVATRLGLRVPATVQTSDPDTAEAFVNTQLRRNGGCIVKSLTTVSPTTPERRRLCLWSYEITPDQRLDYRTLHWGQSIFQQLVRGIDVRVTVVGDRAFAARITTTNPDTGPYRDYRIVGHGVPGAVLADGHDLSPRVAQACVDLTRALDLECGSIDLIVDGDGEYWFLEINPNGMWALIESQTQQPIGKAHAELLVAGAHGRRNHESRSVR